MKNKLLIGLPLIGLLSLGGCATVGSGDFACSGLPTGVQCEPASNLYNKVDKPGFGIEGEPGYDQSAATTTTRSGRRLSRNNLSRKDTGKAETNHDNRTGRAGERFFGSVPNVPATEPDQLFLLNPPVGDGTDPIRRSANQRKIWIAPWVDKQGAYHSEQSVYIDITSATWANGEQNSSKSPIFRPLNN